MAGRADRLAEQMNARDRRYLAPALLALSQSRPLWPASRAPTAPLKLSDGSLRPQRPAPPRREGAGASAKRPPIDL